MVLVDPWKETHTHFRKLLMSNQISRLLCFERCHHPPDKHHFLVHLQTKLRLQLVLLSTQSLDQVTDLSGKVLFQLCPLSLHPGRKDRVYTL